MTTRRDELSVAVESVALLGKALVEPPDKYRGLTDVETRYRQRYLDLECNERTRQVFRIRHTAVRAIREHLTERGFTEVEGPVLQSIQGGATARPFVTHHNALDLDLYLRIALELHLKRLIVGGLERVFEIGRVFRNEGIDTRHNPEFTMLEAYQAFADYHDMMDLAQGMVVAAARAALGDDLVVRHGGHAIDLPSISARAGPNGGPVEPPAIVRPVRVRRPQVNRNSCCSASAAPRRTRTSSCCGQATLDRANYTCSAPPSRPASAASRGRSWRGLPYARLEPCLRIWGSAIRPPVHGRSVSSTSGAAERPLYSGPPRARHGSTAIRRLDSVGGQPRCPVRCDGADHARAGACRHRTNERPAGGSSQLAARRCRWWPTCVRARPTPIWLAGSRSAPRRCTAMCARPSRSWWRWPRLWTRRSR